MMLALRLLTSISVIFLASMGAVNAASSDCLIPTSPFERMICADEELSKAYAEVGTLYTSALSHLSPRGKNQLRDDQRSWLMLMTTQACRASPTSVLAPGDKTTTSCFSQLYDERAKNLRQVGIRKGPFTFTRVDHYAASWTPAVEPDHGQVLARRHTAFPLIDKPDTQAIRRLSQLLTRKDKGSFCDTRDGDADVDYRLGLATTRLVSVAWTASEQCPGTPHGFATLSAQTLVLAPSPRPMQPGDLFGVNHRWQAKLSAFVLEALRKKVPGHCSEPSFDTERVTRAVRDPKSWFLLPGGLRFVLNSKEDLNLCYGLDVSDLEIPWAALRDVMTRKAVTDTR